MADPTGLEIRPVALNEFSLLPEIEAESDTLFDTLSPPISLANLPAPDSPESYANALHIMVAGRPPVAFVRLEIVDGHVHLEQLSVIPSAARQGVGRALVHAAKAWSKESGYTYMTLCTFADVVFNAPFYARCGFSEIDPDDYGPELTRLRETERNLGLDDLGRRVAMGAIL